MDQDSRRWNPRSWRKSTSGRGLGEITKERGHAIPLEAVRPAGVSDERLLIASPTQHKDATNDLTPENVSASVPSTDSGYQSAASASVLPSTRSQADGLHAIQRHSRQIEGTKYFIFKKEVSKDAVKRYQSVRLVIEDLLVEAVTETQCDKFYRLAIRLVVIGETEEDAALHLVIFCAPDIEILVQRVMQSPAVRDLLSYSRPYVNPLDFLIIPKAPKGTSGSVQIDVSCNNTFANKYTTFCGAPILLQAKLSGSTTKKERQGTFGGIIKVVYGNGDFKLYGMTAGHIVEDLQTNAGYPPGSSTSDWAVDASPKYEINDWICEHNRLGQVLDQNNFPGVSSGTAIPSHDWALFDVNCPRANSVIPREGGNQEVHARGEIVHRIIKAERPKFGDDLSEPVLLLSGTQGALNGELSSLPARIWMGKGTLFVDAYTLELTSGTVREGDSGAWVVHSAAPELYGHVVATDALGDAYMIPALDTFENIRDCLGAVSVQPAVEKDFEHLATSYSSSPQMRDYEEVVRECEHDGSSSHQQFATLGHTIKRWNSKFSEERTLREEPPLLQCIHTECSDGEFLKLFFNGYREEEISEFFRVDSVNRLNPESNSSIGGQAKALLADRCWGGGSRTYPIRMTAQELLAALRQKRYNADGMPDAERRHIYITDMDTNYILALAKATPPHQAGIIRGIIWKHLTFETSLRVSMHATKRAEFLLEFHLPHFKLRKRASPADDVANSKKSRSTLNGVDISFLDMHSSLENEGCYQLYDSRISIAVSGDHDSRYVAYAFVDTNFNRQHPNEKDEDEKDEDEKDEDENDKDENGEEGSDEDDSDNESIVTAEDLVLSDGVYATAIQVSDARTYFLQALNYRTEQVLLEWKYLVYSIERSIRRKRPRYIFARHTNLAAVMDSLRWIMQTRELLRLMLDRLSMVNQEWERFDAPSGAINYFRDVREHARISLEGTRESMEGLMLLRRSLFELDQYCANKFCEVYQEFARLDAEEGLRRSTRRALGLPTENDMFVLRNGPDHGFIMNQPKLFTPVAIVCALLSTQADISTGIGFLLSAFYGVLMMIIMLAVILILSWILAGFSFYKAPLDFPVPQIWGRRKGHSSQNK